MCSAWTDYWALCRRISASGSLAHTLRNLETQPPTTKGLQTTITTKAGCKIHPCPHIQSNVMFTLNPINIVPQLHRPQILSFGHLVHDHDNLTPSLYHSSHLSHLYYVIRVFSQYPHSLPHPIIRGPFPTGCYPKHEIQSWGNPVHYKMPVEIIREYPWILWNCLELEEEKTSTYYWVEQGVFLIEDKLDYKCASCKNTLIRIIKYKEEKY